MGVERVHADAGQGLAQRRMEVVGERRRAGRAGRVLGPVHEALVLLAAAEQRGPGLGGGGRGHVGPMVGPRPCGRLRGRCAASTSTSTARCWAGAPRCSTTARGASRCSGCGRWRPARGPGPRSCSSPAAARPRSFEDARLLGQRSYIFEAGAALVLDGERRVADRRPACRASATIHDQITASGAPGAAARALRRPARVPRALARRPRGLPPLPRPRRRRRGRRAAARAGPRGTCAWSTTATVRSRSRRRSPGSTQARAYHLVPAAASKAGAVARHMQARGYARDGLHRRRRLARGSRRRRRGRHVLAGGQRRGARPDAARGDRRAPRTSAWPRRATARASTRPSSRRWPSGGA